VIRAHQPGSEPIDIPETIPNPVVVPKPIPAPTEPAPKEPVRTPEKVPQNVFAPAKAGASFFYLRVAPAALDLLFRPARSDQKHLNNACTFLIAVAVVCGTALPCLAEAFQERIAVCLTCHGESGQSENVEVPSLGAEPAPFVLIQLYLFREKQRRVEPMNDVTKDLTDDDLRRFSDFIAKLPAPKPPQESPDAARIERGRALARARISKEGIRRWHSVPFAASTLPRTLREARRGPEGCHRRPNGARCLPAHQDRRKVKRGCERRREHLSKPRVATDSVRRKLKRGRTIAPSANAEKVRRMNCSIGFCRWYYPAARAH
jgi:cytochrome c553